MPREGAIFVGRLSKNTRPRDLEDVFEPYGRMSRCEVKYGAEMAYAFIDFDDKRDAEDAIRYENGREIGGSAIIVEWTKGPKNRDNRGFGGRGGARPFDECYRCHRTGHFARDCPDDRNYGYRRPGRDGRRSPSPKRRSSRRSRSRSQDRKRSRSRSRDRRRSRSRSPRRSERKRSPSRSKSRSRSRSKSQNSRADKKARSRSNTPSSPKSKSRSRSRSKD